MFCWRGWQHNEGKTNVFLFNPIKVNSCLELILLVFLVKEQALVQVSLRFQGIVSHDITVYLTGPQSLLGMHLFHFHLKNNSVIFKKCTKKLARFTSTEHVFSDLIGRKFSALILVPGSNFDVLQNLWTHHRWWMHAKRHLRMTSDHD